jgi:iron complex outermembrane recepter protein
MVQVRRPAWLLVCPFVVWALPALAQPAGTISGVVRDASGAAVAGATLTATSQGTSAAHTAVTSSDGRYSLQVPPGVYTVTAVLKGVGQQTQRELKVDAGATLKADFSLETRHEEVITVTALKRESTIQETPFSLVAEPEADLRAHGVDDIEGVARDVAGFSVQNLGPGQSPVAMRGVSSGQIARDQPGVKEQVGAYLDESVISLSLFTPDIDLFDVSRVEVLRGPQGTLFGSGSESGTVRYITNQPELGATKFFGELGGDTVSGGNQGGDVKLGVNAPLGKTVAVRAVGYYNRLAGYMDAVQPDLSVKKHVNTGDRTGVRVALKIAPDERLSITPRFVYQKVSADGWNRIDAFNILANPYTTTRPAVTLGPRQQFTQIGEPYDDKFALGDLNIGYRFGPGLTLTSITSYTHREVTVVRDSGALTSSITGGSIGLPENVYTLDAPLNDVTRPAKAWTEELRLSGLKGRLHWVAGGFYANTKRDYNQSLPVAGFEELSGVHTQGVYAPKDVLYWADLHYKLEQFAAFGEGTWTVSDRFSVTGGLRYYHFSEDKAQIFDGIFGSDANGNPVSQPGTTTADGVAPRFIVTYKVSDSTNLNAQASKGFRLGGVNDPINVNLCTPQDRVTFGGRDRWQDESAWNYEIGSKSRIFGHRGSFNVSAFYMDIHDLQATVTAGSCSSRLVYNVPKSRSMGAEAELSVAPNNNFDFSISASYDDAVLRSSVTAPQPDGSVIIVSGIESGSRLPSVPQFQMSAAATYRWQMMQKTLGYVTGAYQHVGSRYTQVGDDVLAFPSSLSPGTLDMLSFGKNTIGGPLTQRYFVYDPKMPAYDILNLRLGVVRGKWDVSLYGNNLTDERALLSLDRERGTRARIGFVTNQPRTFGITARFDF